MSFRFSSTMMVMVFLSISALAQEGADEETDSGVAPLTEHVLESGEVFAASVSTTASDFKILLAERDLSGVD